MTNHDALIHAIEDTINEAVLTLRSVQRAANANLDAGKAETHAAIARTAIDTIDALSDLRMTLGGEEIIEFTIDGPGDPFDFIRSLE